jgi:hypothetical protein
LQRALGDWQAASSALSKLLLKPADIPELTEDLPGVIPLARGMNATQRKEMESSAHDEEYFGRQQSEDDDGDQDLVQPSIKFARLTEQLLFYGDNLDDDPIDYHDVEVDQESLRNLLRPQKI